MSREWKRRSSELVSHYSVFNLRREIFTSPRNGADLTAYVLETRDWVNIIPLTKHREVVLVRQFRFATETITLETPGGLADGLDESMQLAARREMIEETGYDSDEIIQIGHCHPNPAILNNSMYFFLAKNCELKYPQSLDDGEDIQVELVPLSELEKLIVNGAITHGLVLNGLYFMELYLRGHKQLYAELYG